MDLSERGDRSALRHPWETVRAAFFIELLGRQGLLSGAVRWLDVGAGDGWLTRELADASSDQASFVCWDINYDDTDLSAFEAADARIRFAGVQPESVFDALLLLDVIEHVEDDAAFLGAVVRDRLRPGGTALISVPAWQRLFSQHDVALNHFRRYSPAQARSVLSRSGLDVESEGGLFHGLVLPRAVQVVLEHAGRHSPSTGIGAWEGGPRLTRAVEGALRADAWASRRLSDRGLVVPGLSYWALCRKR